MLVVRGFQCHKTGILQKIPPYPAGQITEYGHKLRGVRQRLQRLAVAIGIAAVRG